MTAPLQLYTVAEACQLLRCCDRTLRREVKRGRLKRTRIGRAVRFSARALEDYVARNTRPTR
jgi:excisionase family DNA binding protein